MQGGVRGGDVQESRHHFNLGDCSPTVQGTGCEERVITKKKKKKKEPIVVKGKGIMRKGGRN